MLSGKREVALHFKVLLYRAFAAEAPEDGSGSGTGQGGAAGDLVNGVVVAGGDEVVASGGAGGDFVDAWAVC